MNIEHIETLMYNPVFLSKIIQCFLTGYKKDVDYKTLFYVLPIVMYKDSRCLLNSAVSTSTIYSLFDKEDFKIYKTKINTKFFLNQVAELFSDYVEITKQTIIILTNQKKIILKGKISLIEDFDYKKSNSLIREYFKAAHYLGVILSKVELDEFEQFIEIKLGA